MPKLLKFDEFTLLICEKMSQITHFCGVKLLAWKSGCVKYLTNIMGKHKSRLHSELPPVLSQICRRQTDYILIDKKPAENIGWPMNNWALLLLPVDNKKFNSSKKPPLKSQLFKWLYSKSNKTSCANRRSSWREPAFNLKRCVVYVLSALKRMQYGLQQFP